MEDATEFGCVLRGHIQNANHNQDKLSKELKISTGAMSNYLTGKAIPKMDFLLKCIKKLKIEPKDLPELFHSYFLSTSKVNKKIDFDARLITQFQNEMLAKVLTVFILTPEDTYRNYIDVNGRNRLYTEIDTLFFSLKDRVEFNPPSM